MTEDSWHLSKSIPLTLIFAIACQTIALIWFVATLRNDVDLNRNNIKRLEEQTASLQAVVHSQAVTLGRMDENIKSIRIAVEAMAEGE
jgi:hypothetical protein